MKKMEKEKIFSFVEKQETKICTKCKKEYPKTSEFFNRDSRYNILKYVSQCNKCTKI